MNQMINQTNAVYFFIGFMSVTLHCLDLQA